MRIIHGQECEERSCACGCDRRFWVKTTSSQTYASMYCAIPKNGWKEQRDRSKDQAPPPGRLTVQQLAGKLDVSPATVYSWVKTKKIPFYRYGRKGIFFDESAVRMSLKRK